MGLSVAHGVITEPGATGNQVIDLSAKPGWTAGDTPKAIIIVWTLQNAEGLVDHYQITVGLGTWDGAQDAFSYSHTSLDANATADQSSDGDGNLGSIIQPGVVTIDAAFSLAGVSADDFTINWSNLSTLGGTKIGYLALGGDAITNATVFDFDVPAATGNADINVGFDPDLLIFLGPGRQAASITPTASSSIGGVSFGVGNRDGQHYAAGLMEDDGAATPAVGYWQQAGIMLQMDQTTPSTEVTEVALASSAVWPSGDFTINVINAPSADVWCAGLALKGTFESKVVALNTPAAGGDSDHDPGFDVKGALLFGGNCTPSGGSTSPNTTAGALGQLWFGLTDGATQSVHGGLIEDNRSSSNTKSHYDADFALQMKFADDGSDLVTASPSFPGGVFRMNYPTTDGNSYEYIALLLGEASGEAPAVPNLQTVRSALSWR